MGLKIKRNVNGELRRYWYAQITRSGEKIDIKLGKVRGVIPVTDSGSWDRNSRGDAAFEESRKAAEKELASRLRGDAATVKELRKLDDKRKVITGRPFGKTPLSSLYKKWLSLARSEAPTEDRAKIAKRVFRGFTKFAARYTIKNGGVCSTLEQVTSELAADYFRDLCSRYKWETVKGYFSLLRNAWGRWSTERELPNPFKEVIVKHGHDAPGARTNHEPLDRFQVGKLFDIVQESDPSLYPLVVCVATTGLRLVDAVSLEWDDVHLEKNPAKRREGMFGTIGGARGREVVTKKTGSKVIVPILREFYDVLVHLEEKRDSREKLVFPVQFGRYWKRSTRDGLRREIRPYLALATRGNPDGEAEDVRTPLTLDEILEKISSAPYTPEKRVKVEKVARACFAGTTFMDMVRDLGFAKSVVYGYIRDLEELTGERNLNGRNATRRTRVDRRSLLRETQVRDSVGRAAARYSWHSLRATYVVLAVEAGLPLAYVEKIVGHKTVEMTLQYFNPTQQHAAEFMAKASAGSFLGNSPAPVMIEAKPTKDQIVDAVSALSEEEKKELARKLLGL